MQYQTHYSYCKVWTEKKFQVRRVSTEYLAIMGHSYQMGAHFKAKIAAFTPHPPFWTWFFLQFKPFYLDNVFLEKKRWNNLKPPSSGIVGTKWVKLSSNWFQGCYVSSLIKSFKMRPHLMSIEAIKGIWDGKLRLSSGDSFQSSWWGHSCSSPVLEFVKS